MNSPISGVYSLEVALTGNSKQYIGDIPVLRNKIIKYVDIIRAGHALSGRALSDKGLLTLTDTKGKEFFSQYPVVQLCLGYHGGSRLLVDRAIDFTKSYVNLPADAGNAASLVFVFYYKNDTIDSTSMYSDSDLRDLDFHEIPLTVGKLKYQFPEKLTLQNRLIRAIIAPTTSQFEGVDLVTPAGFNAIDLSITDAYLTLYFKGKELFTRYPLSLLTTSQVNELMPLRNIPFDVTNSFVEFAAGTVITAGTSLFLNFELKRK